MPPKSISKPIVKKTVSSSRKYLYAIGRRKTATARIRLFAKPGDSLVNQVAVSKYFPGPLNQIRYEAPFQVTETQTKLSFTAMVSGSGKTAQLTALSHGLARALVKLNPDFKTSLKQAGLLTRDPRMKESRKVGTGGKARRKKQSPKR